MKLVETIQAEGHVLCQDITQIIPGVYKGAKFKKGHIVTKEDIPVLLSIGKEHLYVWEKDENMLHENEAAEILYKMCAGAHMSPSEVKEGKIEAKAEIDGLLKIDTDLLEQVNSLGEMMIATRYPNLPVKKGEKLCGTRIIPLVIEKEKMERARAVCQGKTILRLLPYQKKRVGIVTTGSEVYKGLIQDAFGPVLRAKVEEYGAEVIRQIIVDDDPEHTKAAIKELILEGADLVLCSGGMSVDPDDKTPLAIRETGAEVVSYGAPVLPGAMFLLAYLTRERENVKQTVTGGAAEQAGKLGASTTEEQKTAGRTIPILGLPGCVMYAKRTIFDLVLPRIMADDPITAAELAKLGRGGLCLNCEVCHYPNCQFGKGW